MGAFDPASTTGYLSTGFDGRNEGGEKNEFRWQ